MTEATTEEGQTEEQPDAGAEVPAERKTLERRAETTEDTHTDREDYQPQTNERIYSKKAEYKKSQKETSSKKYFARNYGGLEKVLADSKAISKELGIDETELLSARLARRFYAAHGEAKSVSEKDVPESAYDSHDGINYIPIWDPGTGELYFSVEIKTDTYRFVEARGKFALHGETGRVGESFLETAVRGIIEENPNSHGVLLKALKENGEVHDRIKTYVDGVPSESYIIDFKIKDADEWHKFARDINPEAPKIIMSLTEFSKTKRSDWAFDHYDVLAGILEKNLKKAGGDKKEGSTMSHFIPMTYTKPIGQYSFN